MILHSHFAGRVNELRATRLISLRMQNIIYYAVYIQNDPKTLSTIVMNDEEYFLKLFFVVLRIII